MESRFDKTLIVECELGGPKNGASLAGRSLFTELDINTEIINVINTPIRKVRESSTPSAHYLSEINNCLEKISDAVELHFTVNYKERLFVVAGDHSTACGTLAGFKKAFPDYRIGAVWIDAHADIHSPYTSPSGNVHGMPVAAALGDDHYESRINELDEDTISLWNKTKDICSKSIDYRDLVYVGIRDLEDAEWDIVSQKNIKYHTVEQVEYNDIKKTAEDILDYLNECDLIYVSFDIDSMDSSVVPGTGTPVSEGLSILRTKALLEHLCASEKVKMLEVVEINPLLDSNNETAKTVASVLTDIL